MKHAVSIEITLPRAKVAQLHGQLGTRSRVVMQMGKQRFACAETITRREPADLRAIPAGSPVHFERELVAKGRWTAVRDQLIEAGPETARWVSESEYRHVQDFKAFAEQGKDVREAKD